MSQANTATITDVDWDGAVDCELFIHLNNGHSVLFHLNIKRNDPRFPDVAAGRCRATPKTDGLCVYWPGGPRMSFDELMEMVVA